MSLTLFDDLGPARTADEVFPEHREAIGRLRASDPVFDEICRDFEILAQLTVSDPQGDAARAESLTGLVEEIRSHLSWCTTGG